MQKPVYYLNGKNIRSLHTLGKALRATFYFEDHLNLKNLNVVNDVLRGGFGALKYQEPYTVVWQHYKTTERFLDPELLEALLDSFNDKPYVELILE